MTRQYHAILAVAAFALSMIASSSSSAESIRIAYTAATRGYLESFPDSTGERAGGLAARAAVLESMAPDVIIEAGGFLRSQSPRRRARAQLECMNLMRYDLIHLSAADYSVLPTEQLVDVLSSFGGAWLASNVKPRAEVAWPALELGVLTIDDATIRCIGLVDRVGAGYDIEDPAASLRRLLPIAAPRAVVDRLIVVSDLDPAANDALVTEFPEIDCIIGLRETRSRGRITPATVGGRAVGGVVLAADRSIETRRHAIGVDRVNSQVRTRLIDYYNSVAEDDQSAPDGQLMAMDDNRFIGVAACAVCHVDAHRGWVETAHAGAYDRLLESGDNDRPECVACHTTGFSHATGFQLSGLRPHFAGVQCESCHGPGGRHSRLPDRSTIQLGGRGACITCHDSVQSPDFAGDVQRYLAGGIHDPADDPAARVWTELAERRADKPQVDLFVMSFCPYGTAAEQALIHAWEKTGESFDLDIHYIVRLSAETAAPRPAALSTDDGACTDAGAPLDVGEFGVGSLHGEPEVLENLRQLAIRQLYPDRFFDYLRLRARDLDVDWRRLALELGMDVEKIDGGARSEAVTVLLGDADLVRTLGVDASPTVFVDGVLHDGGLGSGFGRAVCEAMAVPSAFCRSLTECDVDGDCQAPGKEGRCVEAGSETAHCVYTDAPAVTLHVINDPGCGLCNPAVAVSSAMLQFANLDVVAHPASSAMGAAMLDRHTVASVPAYIFEGIEQSVSFGSLASMLIENDGQYMLDPDWIGLGPLYFGRPAERRVDLFVHATGTLSQSLLDAMAEPLAELGNDVPVFLHHLLESREPDDPHAMRLVQSGGRAVMVPESSLPHFGSRLGEADVAEARRQVCLSLHHRDRLLEYLVGRPPEAAEADGWRQRLADLGLQPARLGMCAGRGEADPYLVAGMAFADSLRIRRPAVLVGNRLRFDGLGPWNSGALRRALREMN